MIGDWTAKTLFGFSCAALRPLGPSLPHCSGAGTVVRRSVNSPAAKAEMGEPVPKPEGRLQGTVNWFNVAKGFGALCCTVTQRRNVTAYEVQRAPEQKATNRV